MSAPRSLLVTWYGGLLAGLLPVLLLGFLYSALADRIAFAGWALAVAVLWVLVLRHGLGAGWGRARLAGTLFLLIALGLAAFARLETQHGEILDLGFRAVLPGLYHPSATQPRTAWAVAAVFGILGIVSLLVWGARSRKEMR
ncbi:MAG TPA: hypothetical protein VE685_18280 [Thermoanaerobaculia bacterium]|nr:hypothetical protein [Thermoanaerobaculia bacterium]